MALLFLTTLAITLPAAFCDIVEMNQFAIFGMRSSLFGLFSKYGESTFPKAIIETLKLVLNRSACNDLEKPNIAHLAGAYPVAPGNEKYAAAELIIIG